MIIYDDHDVGVIEYCVGCGQWVYEDEAIMGCCDDCFYEGIYGDQV